MKYYVVRVDAEETILGLFSGPFGNFYAAWRELRHSERTVPAGTLRLARKANRHGKPFVTLPSPEEQQAR